MAGDLMAMSGAAYDAQALNGLKRDAASDPQGNLKQVAQQVEGMFVQMMLKSMRAALPQDGILSSDQSRLYTSMGFYAGTPDFSVRQNYPRLSSFMPSARS